MEEKSVVSTVKIFSANLNDSYFYGLFLRFILFVIYFSSFFFQHPLFQKLESKIFIGLQVEREEREKNVMVWIDITIFLAPKNFEDGEERRGKR